MQNLRIKLSITFFWCHAAKPHSNCQDCLNNMLGHHCKCIYWLYVYIRSKNRKTIGSHNRSQNKWGLGYYSYTCFPTFLLWAESGKHSLGRLRNYFHPTTGAQTWTWIKLKKYWNLWDLHVSKIVWRQCFSLTQTSLLMLHVRKCTVGYFKVWCKLSRGFWKCMYCSKMCCFFPIID